MPSPEVGTAIVAGGSALFGGGLSSILFKLLLSQWLKSLEEFQKRTDAELSRLKDRVEQVANMGLERRVESIEQEARRLAGEQAETNVEVKVMKASLDNLCERVDTLSTTVSSVGGQVLAGIAGIQKKLAEP